MANVKVSDLPAGSGLNTADITIINQTGVTKRSTAGAMIDTMTGFLQAGTGAVARTVRSKDRDIVSVKDFGALGDDSNDDTAEIQLALDTAVDEIYFPDGVYKISATLTPASDTYLWGPGEIKWTGTFDAITITTKTHVTVDGLRFNGNAGYYAVHAKTVSEFITVVNCHAEECNLFATNGINDAYASQGESTYCRQIVVADNTGNIATAVANTAFVLIAYSRDGTIVGNASVGSYHGILLWGGNITTQDAIANARKCIRVSVTGNVLAPTTGGIPFLLTDSCVSVGNTVTNCAGDVGIDMESCLDSKHIGNMVKVAKVGAYLYGLNRDCDWIGNDIETTGTNTTMIGSNQGAPVAGAYVNMGTVTFRGNYFKNKSRICTADFGLNNHLIVDNNVFENVVLPSEQNAGNTACNIFEFKNNTAYYDFTPTQANILEFGAGVTGFTLESETPTYFVEGNKVINRTGVSIAKRVYGLEAFRNNGRIILKNNFDELWGTSIIVNTNVGVVTREVTVEGQKTNATTPFNYADTTYATVFYDKWLTPAFAAGDFTASASMTWTVASGDVTTYEYRIIGKTMTVNFYIATSTVGGTPDTKLLILIPQARVASKRTRIACFTSDNGTDRASLCEVLASGTTIGILATEASANWTAQTDTAYVAGSITFEIN